MHRIDKLCMEFPFADGRILRGLLVQRIRQMPRPNTEARSERLERLKVNLQLFVLLWRSKISQEHDHWQYVSPEQKYTSPNTLCVSNVAPITIDVKLF